MSFLIENDYLHLIRKEVLDVVINDAGQRLEAENAAEDEIKSYLSTRYDTARLFTPSTAWDPASGYIFNALVYLAGPVYNALTAYSIDDLIQFTDNNIYIALAVTTPGEDPITTPAKWAQLGAANSFYQALQTQYFELGAQYLTGELVVFENKRYQAIQDTTGTQKPTDTNFWVLNTDTVAPGTLVTDTANWTAGDVRKALIVRYMIDITLYELHSRINPRNIPEHRIQRRDDAVSYLKMVADPRKNINPDFPLKDFEDMKGNDIVWGSNPKQDLGQISY